MIKLSNNGHIFEFMAASGALAFDGLGWPWEQPLRWTGLLDETVFTTVIKTLTLKPHQGNLRWYNPFRCIRFLPGGVLNAVGLTNPGIEWWCRKIGPHIDSDRAPLMGSILGEPKELILMAKILNDFNLVGIEINASCPNTQDDVLTNTVKVIDGCRAVKSISRFPIILKLSVVHDIQKIVEGVEGLVETFSINSVPWSVIFPRQRSPLVHLGGGGVSGKIAQPYTWGLVKRLVELTDIPVIGPSVWDFEDIEKLRGLGAEAISFGSVFLKYPWRPTMFVRRDKKRR
jgi:dihydroorotate dehydrogenase (NAD+) catalytic subunit